MIDGGGLQTGATVDNSGQLLLVNEGESMGLHTLYWNDSSYGFGTSDPYLMLDGGGLNVTGTGWQIAAFSTLAPSDSLRLFKNGSLGLGFPVTNHLGGAVQVGGGLTVSSGVITGNGAGLTKVASATNSSYATNAGTAVSVSGSVAASQLTGTIGTGQLGNAILANNGTGNFNTLSNVSLLQGGSWVGGPNGNSFKFTSTNNLTGPIILQDAAAVGFSALVGQTDGDKMEWAIGMGNSGVSGVYSNRLFIASTPGPSGINTNNGGWGADIILAIEGGGGSVGFDHPTIWSGRNFASSSIDTAILAPYSHTATSGSQQGFGWASVYVNGLSGNVYLTNGITTISNATVMGQLNLSKTDSLVGFISVTNLDSTTVSYTISTNLIPSGATYVNGTGAFAGLSVYQLPFNLSAATNYLLNVTNSIENSECFLADLATQQFNPTQLGTNLELFNITGFSNPFVLADGVGTDLTGHAVTYGIYAILSAATNTTFNNVIATGTISGNGAGLTNIARSTNSSYATNAGTAVSVSGSVSASQITGTLTNVYVSSSTASNLSLVSSTLRPTNFITLPGSTVTAVNGTYTWVGSAGAFTGWTIGYAFVATNDSGDGFSHQYNVVKVTDATHITTHEFVYGTYTAKPVIYVYPPAQVTRDINNNGPFGAIGNDASYFVDGTSLNSGGGGNDNSGQILFLNNGSSMGEHMSFENDVMGTGQTYLVFDGGGVGAIYNGGGIVKISTQAHYDALDVLANQQVNIPGGITNWNNAPEVITPSVSTPAENVQGASTLNVVTANRLSVSNGFESFTSNGLPPFSIPTPASTVTWVNTNPWNAEIYIDNSGVTGTSIKKNGTQIFSVVTGDVTLHLQTNESVSITYTSGTPSIKASPY